MPASHVLLDNVLVPADAARISAVSEGFLYGHGVFETIKLLAGRPVFLADHHARLAASARTLDLPYALSADTLAERVLRTAAANGVTDGSAKIVLFNHGDTTGELITAKSGLYSTETYAHGFRLKTVFSGERTGTLSGHKTLNYLANIRAKRAAVAAGFDEPLFVTPAGIVIEGATSNFFVVRDGIVHTPSLAAGPLPGTARARVLALLGPDRARESLLTHDDLVHASEVFVTNALLGVMPVACLDDRVFDLDHAPATRALMEAYGALETHSLS